MRKLTKGEKTRLKIIEVSKQLFYDKGYLNTTYADIASAVGTTLGGITYHFSVKAQFAGEIFSDYINKMYTRLGLSEIRGESWLFLHFVTTYNYFSTIFNDKNTSRFYYEIMNSRQVKSNMNENVRGIYEKIIGEEGIRYTDKEFNAILIADFGARSEIITQIYEGQLEMDPVEAARFVISNSARSLGIPQSKITIAADGAYEYFKAHPYDDIPLLV